MQNNRLKQIYELNDQIIQFKDGYVESWLNFTTEESANAEHLISAKKIIDDEIAAETEMAMNEPQNVKIRIDLTADFLGTITDQMLDAWQKQTDVRVAMAMSRLDSDLAKRATAIRARYTANSTKNRQPILRQRERVLAEYNFFRNIFQRLSRPDEEIECPICLTDDHTKKSIVLTVCGHEFCPECSKQMFTKRPECVVCRRQLTVPRDLRLIDRIAVGGCEIKEATTTPIIKSSVLETYGTKLATLIGLIQKILKRRDCKKIIVYAQFQKLLVLMAGVLEKNGVNFVVAKGSIRQCEVAFRKFRYDNSVRVILLSSEKSISGVHLVEANHMIVVHPTLCSRGVDEEVATFMQAVARMRRLMQKDDCHVWQLITSNTIEEQQFDAQNVLLRSKYAMDVGIHWNAPEEEVPVLQNTDTPTVTAKDISLEEKSRQDVVRLLNGECTVDEGDELIQEHVDDTAAAEEEEELIETDALEENDEKIPMNEWLSSRQYRS